MLEDQERPMLVVLRNSPIIILAGFVPETHLLKITARLYGKRHKGKSVASDQRNNRARRTKEAGNGKR